MRLVEYGVALWALGFCALNVGAQEPFITENDTLNSFDAHFEQVGWPHPDRPLWIVVADSHSDITAYREVLKQASLMRRAIQDHYGSGYKISLKVLHIGDASDGVNIEEVINTARLPGEFGIPKRDRYMTPGNSEWRGFTVFDAVEEAAWRKRATTALQQNARLVKRDPNSHDITPLADDELGYLELWPGTTIALSHKPLHPLMRDARRPDASAVPAAWRNINYRNWIGAPIVFVASYLPGVVTALSIAPNLIPLRANPKALVGDVVFRPMWSLSQQTYRLVGKSLWGVSHPPTTTLRKSGPWFLRDERGFQRRFIERLQALPTWDSETFFTMQRNSPISHDAVAIFHAHTHRGHESLSAVPTQSGSTKILRIIGVPPTFLDSKVPNPGRGWVSISESDGVAMMAIHDATDGGKIAISQPLSADADPRIEDFYHQHGVRLDFPGAIPQGPIACSRFISKIRPHRSGAKATDHIRRLESALKDAANPHP